MSKYLVTKLTPHAAVRYTKGDTNGGAAAEPDDTSPAITGPIELAAPTEIKIKAMGTGTKTELITPTVTLSYATVVELLQKP